MAPAVNTPKPAAAPTDPGLCDLCGKAPATERGYYMPKVRKDRGCNLCARCHESYHAEASGGQVLRRHLGSSFD